MSASLRLCSLSRFSLATSLNTQNTARHLGWTRTRLDLSDFSFSLFWSHGGFGVPARGQPFDVLGQTQMITVHSVKIFLGRNKQFWSKETIPVAQCSHILPATMLRFVETSQPQGDHDGSGCIVGEGHRWNCCHHSGKPKAHVFRRRNGRRANAGDPNIRVVIVTGGTPGYFNRHFSIPALIDFAEAVRASGREWPDNAAYHGGFFDKALALCETMPKPVIAAISGTALAGAFEFTHACDIRIAEDGDYLIGLPETELGLLPGASGTQRLPRTIGPAAALWHILMGHPLNPREAEKRGFVHETVSGKAIDRAMEIAKRLCSHTPESLAYIKRLVRSAIDTPLAEGLALERNLFMRLCVSDEALARMRSRRKEDHRPIALTRSLKEGQQWPKPIQRRSA